MSNGGGLTGTVPIDVSALALEATLTAIKGAGWTTETLKAIKDAIDAVIPGVGDATQAKQDAIKMVVDAILVDTNTTLDAKLDAIKAVTDQLPDAGALNDLAAILTDTGTTIPGLLAIIQTNLDNPNQYKADLTTLEARLSAARAGYLDQLDFNLAEAIAALNTLLSHGTYGLAALETLVDEVETYIKHGTYGLSALQTLLAAITAAGPTKAEMDTGHGLLATVAKQDIIDGIVDAIKISTDKLAGAAPGVGTATQNWNAAENDIVSIGANDTKNKLHSLVLDVSALTATATISIRMYMQVNGVEKKVYDEDFIVGTDPDGLWIVNGTVGIHEVLRVTAQSDNAGDDGKAIAYDYILEAM